MCKLFTDWEEEIRKYCEKNGLNFDKAKKLPKCWGKDNVVLQYFDKDSPKNELGLLDETPAPVVLSIRRMSDGTLNFEQTEFTHRYLA